MCDRKPDTTDSVPGVNGPGRTTTATTPPLGSLSSPTSTAPRIVSSAPPGLPTRMRNHRPPSSFGGGKNATLPGLLRSRVLSHALPRDQQRHRVPPAGPDVGRRLPPAEHPILTGGQANGFRVLVGPPPSATGRSGAATT